MSDSILSQDEIDRLLNGGSSAESEKMAEGAAAESDIKPYDPTTQRRVVRERLHSLEIINERFARQFRMGLFLSLIHISEPTRLSLVSRMPSSA